MKYVILFLAAITFFPNYIISQSDCKQKIIEENYIDILECKGLEKHYKKSRDYVNNSYNIQFWNNVYSIGDKNVIPSGNGLAIYNSNFTDFDAHFIRDLESSCFNEAMNPFATKGIFFNNDKKRMSNFINQLIYMDLTNCFGDKMNHQSLATASSSNEIRWNYGGKIYSLRLLDAKFGGNSTTGDYMEMYKVYPKHSRYEELFYYQICNLESSNCVASSISLKQLLKFHSKEEVSNYTYSPDDNEPFENRLSNEQFKLNQVFPLADGSFGVTIDKSLALSMDVPNIRTGGFNESFYLRIDKSGVVTINNIIEADSYISDDEDGFYALDSYGATLVKYNNDGELVWSFTYGETDNFRVKSDVINCWTQNQKYIILAGYSESKLNVGYKDPIVFVIRKINGEVARERVLESAKGLQANGVFINTKGLFIRIGHEIIRLTNFG